MFYLISILMLTAPNIHDHHECDENIKRALKLRGKVSQDNLEIYSECLLRINYNNRQLLFDIATMRDQPKFTSPPRS